MAEYIKMGPGAAESIDAYLEYRRIVGEDDEEKLFSPEEYEKYKRTVVPARIKNRLFVSWTSPNGWDCKLIGPETPCFCQHRYKQHKTDFAELPTERPILLPCRVKGCRCTCYSYVPLNGSQPIRCRCKHYVDDHSTDPSHTCKKGGCQCVSFKSSFTCSCSQPTYAHDTIIETKEERQVRGHPVGHDVPYAAMGGLTGFSSLAEAYQRLDDSGIGAPSEEYLNKPISASDHPFLRMHAATVNQLEHGRGRQTDALTQKMAEFKLTGTDADMDYYEMRYQQRLKEERMQAKGVGLPYSKRGLPSSSVASSPASASSSVATKGKSTRGKPSSASNGRPSPSASSSVATKGYSTRGNPPSASNGRSSSSAPSSVATNGYSTRGKPSSSSRGRPSSKMTEKGSSAATSSTSASSSVASKGYSTRENPLRASRGRPSSQTTEKR